MRIAFKVGIISLAVLLLLFSSLIVWASAYQRFIFTRELHVSDFVPHLNDDYAANVTDSGQELAHLYIRIEPPMVNSNRVPVLFEIWHAENTELDSLALRFSTGLFVTTMQFEATSYTQPLEFRRDNRAVLFSIKDLGLYGTGTVTLDFTLIKYSNLNELTITADFSMHYESPLQLTALNGHSFLNTQIPS